MIKTTSKQLKSKYKQDFPVIHPGLKENWNWMGVRILKTGHSILGVMLHDGCFKPLDTLAEPNVVYTPNEFVVDNVLTHTFREKHGQHKVFLNEDRHRKYGVRPSDIVQERPLSGLGKPVMGIVSTVDTGDNNCVYCYVEGRTELVKFIPEWCDVLTKAEDR